MVNKKEVKLIPKLRFPEFKDDWTIRKIGDFVKERKDTAGQELPLYSLTIENGIIPKSKRYERSFLVKGKEDAYKQMLPGDFAFNPMNLRFGALAMHKGDLNVAVSKYYNIFYCNTEGNPSYLESYLTCYNMIGYYNRMSTGTLEEKKRVHYLDFVHFKKPFPILPEQEKIASFLSAVDKKIAQMTAKKELLEQYKKGVMQKIFSQPQQIRFTDDNGKNYPDWQEKKLGDIGEFKGGGTPSTHNDKFWTGGIPWISSSDLTEDSISNINITRFINNDTIVNSATNLIPANSILIVSRVGVGKVAVNKKALCTSQDFTSLISFTENPIFLAYFIKVRTRKLLAFNQGTSIKGFVKSDLKELSFPIPPQPEQQKIASFLSGIDKKIESVQSQLIQTQTFKKGLLQQLFV